MLSCQIEGFVELCKASGIPVEPLDPTFFKAFSQGQISLQDHQAQETQPFDHRNQAFWNKLTTKIIPTWSLQAELPHICLRPLLELVDDYFFEASRNKDVSCFSKQALAWAVKFQEDCSLEELQCLFGQPIQVGNESFYLIEILAKCLQAPFSDENKKLMLGIVRWLSICDASLIGNAPEFESIYAELKIGPKFNLDSLREALISLPIPKGSELEKSAGLVSQLLEGKIKINSEIIDGVLEFFKLRWIQMLKAESTSESAAQELPSYLLQQNGVNAPWIRLAQTLCGAGWLKPRDPSIKTEGNPKHREHNYFAILMPTTAGQNTDTLTLECVVSHGLYNYILSSDNRELILFNNSIRTYEAEKRQTGTANFGCYQDSTYNRAFTELEIKRIKAKECASGEHPHGVKRYMEYLPHAERYTKMPVQPISIKTVRALAKLVKASTFPNGLRYAEKYDELQMHAAGAAYHHFYNFLNGKHQENISPEDLIELKEEIERLKRQRIRFKGIETTFSHVISRVENPDDEDACIAGCNIYFIALILSYTDMEFSPEVESIIERYNMRENPGKNVFRDYMFLSEEEAKRRILIILVSIMSHYFQYPLLGNSVSLGGCSNTMVDVTNQIFQLLNGTIIKGSQLDFEHARYMYVKIMESIIKPALGKNAAWYADTRQWIESIVSDSLFGQNHAWIRPEVLLAKLSLTKTNPAIYDKIERFLDELVAVYMCNGPSSEFKALQVNIKFAQLLQTLTPKIRSAVVSLFTAPQRPVAENTDFIELYINYLTQRLAYIGATASTASHVYGASFFSRAPCPTKATLQPIINALSGRDRSSIDKVIQDLSDKIPGLEPSLCNERGKDAMVKYLKEIRVKGGRTAKPAPNRPMSPTSQFFAASAKPATSPHHPVYVSTMP